MAYVKNYKAACVIQTEHRVLLLWLNSGGSNFWSVHLSVQCFYSSINWKILCEGIFYPYLGVFFNCLKIGSKDFDQILLNFCS